MNVIRGVILLSVISATKVYCADSYFNPAFLSPDLRAVADLSRFSTPDAQPDGVYPTDVYVNENYVGNRPLKFIHYKPGITDAEEPVQGAGGLVPCLTPQLINELGYANEKEIVAVTDEAECVSLKKIHPDTHVIFSFADMKLKFLIPQASLSSQPDGYIDPARWDEGVPALMLNYRLSGEQSRGSRSYYASLNGALNAGAWRLHNQSALNYSQSGTRHTSEWNNISTYAERDLPGIKSILNAGDTFSGGEVFDSVSFRGLRVYSADEMLPDSQQGYAPTISGVARTSARVVVRHNGYVIYQKYVPPGPFSIRDLSSASASGDLNVTVEEKDGRSETFSVPFSTLPVLRREGQLRYDIVAGAYRSGNDQQTRPYIFQGSLQRGFRHSLTSYGGAQLSNHYRSVLLGLGKNLGHIGAVSADITHAQAQLSDNSLHEGQSMRFLYAKSVADSGTTIRLTGYRYSTRNFYSLSDTTYRTMRGYSYDTTRTDNKALVFDFHNLSSARKARLEATISQSLGGYGSLNLTGGQQTYWNGTGKQTWYQLGYNTSWKKISYGLSVSRSRAMGQYRGDTQLTFNLSVPLSMLSGSGAVGSSLRNAYLTSTAVMNNQHRQLIQSGISGTALEDGRLAYSVQTSRSVTGNGGTTSLGYTGSRGKADASYSYDSTGGNDFSWQAEGGMVTHAGGLTLTQPLGDTNILVSAPGAGNVKIAGQVGMETDSRGFTVIPYASAYRRNRVELDTATASKHTDIVHNITDVIPTQGALVRADFTVRTGYRVLFTLHRQGKSVPFGADVRESASEARGLTDEQGQAYLTGLPEAGMLTVRWGKTDSDTCRVKYHLAKNVLEQLVIIQNEECN